VGDHRTRPGRGHQNLSDAGQNAAIGCLVDGTFRLPADDYHLRGILGQAFGITPDTIDLTYPSTSEQER
jgi:hypothetical protein